MDRPNPMFELCALMARGELTFETFGTWSKRHYGAVLGTEQVNALFDDFDKCLAKLSSTQLSTSLSRLLPVLVRLATAAPRTGEVYRLAELRSAMNSSTAEGANRVLLAWISRHHGEPRSIDQERLKAIISDLDTVLMGPDIQDSDFTRAMMRVRGMLAQHAGLAPPVTITIDAEPIAPPFPRRSPPVRELAQV